jgi:hypothetical protein
MPSPSIISDLEILSEVKQHFDIRLDNGQVVFRPKEQDRLTPDQKIDRMAEVLFQDIKEHINQLQIYSSADNSDMLGIDETMLYKDMILRLLRYWKA